MAASMFLYCSLVVALGLSVAGRGAGTAGAPVLAGAKRAECLAVVRGVQPSCQPARAADYGAAWRYYIGRIARQIALLQMPVAAGFCAPRLAAARRGFAP